MGRRIDVVDYDPHWIEAFKSEAALARFFGERAQIHHIGGFAQKPKIEMIFLSLR